jgi:hypothetical protein
MPINLPKPKEVLNKTNEILKTDIADIIRGGQKLAEKLGVKSQDFLKAVFDYTKREGLDYIETLEAMVKADGQTLQDFIQKCADPRMFTTETISNKGFHWAVGAAIMVAMVGYSAADFGKKLGEGAMKVVPPAIEEIQSQMLANDIRNNLIQILPAGSVVEVKEIGGVYYIWGQTNFLNLEKDMQGTINPLLNMIENLSGVSMVASSVENVNEGNGKKNSDTFKLKLIERKKLEKQAVLSVAGGRFDAAEFKIGK